MREDAGGDDEKPVDENARGDDEKTGGDIEAGEGSDDERKAGDGDDNSGSLPRCPRCGSPVTMVTIVGPTDQYASPCGCHVTTF